MSDSLKTQKNDKHRADDALPKRYLLRYGEAAEFFGVSQSIIERLAKESDAVYRYGKVCWVNTQKVTAYLECCNGNIWEE